MKFSKVSLLAASASVALSAPVAVTVTQHVHQAATVVVQGIVRVENGQTLTTFITKGTQTASASPVATTSAPIVVANARVDSIATSVIQESAVVAESATFEESSTETSEAFSTATATIQAVQTSASATQDDVTTTLTSSTQPTSTTTPTTTTTSPTTTASPTTTTASPTTATTTQSTASSTQSSSSDFSTSMVNEHNTKRALHKDTGSLTWSDTLATYAQNYADSYDCSGNLVHSGGPYGENLALGYGTTGSVDAWYNEITSYDYSNPGFSESAGHFTQVVWKGTSEVGCGLKSCGGAWGDYIICSYKAAGNVIGEFADNVMPLA
ncbi:protein PRY2 [Saccharomyces cerevisiae]|nr:protein PRY2 [Saccharomyces cerevisiae]GFP72944.1 protein PRY2 [Saccharomyces cerevisiae]